MVSVMSNTRIEWCIADLGILGAAATTVPIYQSNTPDDTQFILNDSSSVALFVEDAAQLAKIRTIRDQIPRLSTIIVFSGSVERPDEISWETFLEAGEKYLAECEPDITARGRTLTADDILTLIYTSGTTGRPKGVIITHDNMLYEAEACEQVGLVNPHDVEYFFLPMAHVFAKVLEVIWLRTGHTMAFWEGDMGKIVDNLTEVRPTVVCAVPRVFEKVYARVVADVQAAPGIAGRIGRWGLAQESRATKAERRGGRPGPLWAIAQKLVLAKVHDKLAARFGGRLQFFISGGAPLSPDIAHLLRRSLHR